MIGTVSEYVLEYGLNNEKLRVEFQLFGVPYGLHVFSMVRETAFFTCLIILPIVVWYRNFSGKKNLRLLERFLCPINFVPPLANL